MADPSPDCLKLFGNWASSYTHRVQLALKLKGLQFEYLEEDLANKSPSLLLNNPIYKKVPVLLHGGRPIPESLVILQYIDDAFVSTDHPIVPLDPYEKSVALFWSHFIDDKLGPTVGAVFASTGEVQNAAVGQFHENLKLVETELREGAFRGRRFFGGERIGLLDIVLGCGSYWLSVFEEVAEVKLVDSDAFPHFNSWLERFEEVEEVKEIIPAHDKLLGYAGGLRHVLLSMKGEDDVSNNNDKSSSDQNASNIVVTSES